MSSFEDLVASGKPEDIAKRVLQDKDRIRRGKAPSLLALYLPKASSQQAAEIGAFLAPPAQNLHPSIGRLLYENARSQIVEAIGDVGRGSTTRHDDGYQLAAELDEPLTPGQRRKESKYTPQPTETEIGTTLKVLRFLQEETQSSSTSLDHVVTLIHDRFNLSPNGMQLDDQQRDQSWPEDGLPETSEATTKQEESEWDRHVSQYRGKRIFFQQRFCYICRYVIKYKHPVYKSMCRPCGDFNLAGLRLSLPDSLKLPGRTALVTGARVNLGYYTALRLLRCGARVIVSTRYPNDAAIRYSKETDFLSWQDRLKIVGADFRTARDAFALVRAARLALAEWNVEALDILVNNAAQTLTDSLKKEQRAIFLEQQGQEQATGTGLLFYPEGPTSYQPRIRGGVTPLTLEAAPETKALSFGEEPEDTLVLPDGVKDDGRTEMESYFKSSWVQILSEIPYEDVISAHAVNTFVPLILCRELLPLMGALQSDNKESGSGQPLGYIINVSSREGLFELNPNHSAKRGKHVHTNMSKAALNMITQTEAASAWKTRRVAMNSVDPGFMSAAPEIDAMIGGELPIGWEDGAGRLLWPVAIGEVDGKGVWGRFLKHYGATDVDSTLDRG